MDMLGLGVRLNFEDNMSSEINPLIRDLERLRQQATRTTQTFNNMSGAYNPYGYQRRRELMDYVASTQSLDRALLSISDRLIGATDSARNLSRALNASQFTGSFNRMYSDINRVQRMLGNMGYQATKMQRDMSNLRAFNMLNYQIKDLNDKIKLTTKAMDEMKNSPFASRYAEQIRLAERSLSAYRQQLQAVGSLEQKLATTHGLGVTDYRGKTVLYEKAKNPQEELSNRLLGLAMLDLAYASDIAFKSLSRTGDMMVGTGYSALEARQKLTTMLGTLQMVGMGLTQFLTVPLALATAGIGILINRWEEASNVFHARTLIDPKMWSYTEDSLRDMAIDTGATQMETSHAMSASYNIYGDTKGLDYSLKQAENSLFMFKVHGVSAEKSLRDVNNIMTKFGVSSEQAWDMYVSGAIEAKKETGKGFTGVSGNDRIIDYVEENSQALLRGTNAMGQYQGAFEKMTTAYEKGIMENLIESFGTLGSIIIAVVKPSTPVLEKFFGTIKNGLEGVLEFFRENTVLSKFIAYTTMAVFAIGMLIGPIAVASALMIRYRNVIQGVTHTVASLGKGGFAVLSPQAKMATNLIKAFTVAIARFPQTLLAGAIPALYTFIRQLPMIGINILRLNPLMTALTFGAIAYSKNWMGIGDKVNGVINNIKDGWTQAKDIITKGMGNEAFDLSQFSGMTQVFAKMQGTALIAKKVLTSIFGGTELKFETGEVNLMQQLGIEGFVNTIAIAGKGVKDFWDGFKSGIGEVFDAMKTFYGWMKETFKPVFNWLKDTFIGIADSVSKAFGGDGVKSINDIIGSAKDLNKTMFDLGKIAGVALSAFLGFKLLKPILNMFKNPFAGFITSANRATDAVKTMSGAIRNMPTNALNRMGNNQTAGRAGATTIAGGGMNTGTLSNRQRSRLTTQQEGTYGRTLTNINAQSRGHNMGTAVHGQAGQRYGSTMYARNQGTLSRALFGQRYDTFDEQGRRRTREVRGGLLNRDRTNLQGGVSMRDRVIDGRQRVTQQARTLGTNLNTRARSAGSSLMNTSAVQRVSSAGRAVGNVGRTAIKPVTVPVKWVTGRLQTAGVIRQGTQAGTQSGNIFKRMFNVASRGLGGGARMFTGVVRGAGTAGTRAGQGMLRGMGFVSKGIGGIFKLGFKLIPFLGWALMAWDIISAVFTNWDKIVAGAKNAWDWISNHGMTALGDAWTWIQDTAGQVWSWILSDGSRVAGEIGVAVTNFIGEALSWLITKAGEVFVWILTDGIAMAVKLGWEILKLVGEGFTLLVPWALGKFGEIVGAVWDIGKQIGSNIFEGIKNGFGDIASWFGGKLSSGWETVKGWFGGGGGDNAKKYARGGIINSPHLGLVGEAGPEAIIPLSGNQRDRARNLLTQTAGTLGMTVTPISPKETNINNFVTQMPNVQTSNAKPTFLGSVKEVFNNIKESTFNKEVFNNTIFKDVNSTKEVENNLIREKFNNSISENTVYKEMTKVLPIINNIPHENNTVVRETQSAPVVQKPAPIVRKTSTSGRTSQNEGSQDNSVTIQNLNLNVKDGKEISEAGGRKHAIAIAKELQKIMKQERLRGSGKNLTLEELILNL